MSQLLSDQLTSGSRLPRSWKQGRLSRRTALKLMACGVASAGLSSPAVGQAVDADFTESLLSLAQLSASLTIEIFTGRSTPEDTVLLSSTASHPLMLRQFSPGLIVFGGRAIDLNQLLTSDGLMVGAGAVRAVCAVSLLTRQSDTVVSECLSADALADAAIQNIGSGAEVVTMSAEVDAHGKAFVCIPPLQSQGVNRIT